MKRFISIKAVRAVGIFTLMLTLSVLSQAQPVPVPCCTDFSDSTLHGYGPCPYQPNVDISLRTPGPDGAGDIYLHAEDLPHASLICAGPECLGDWSGVATSGCGAFCFDVKVFEDGCRAGLPECDTNGGWLLCHPHVYIFSDRIRAVFMVSNPAFITDSVGPNPGWHHICAPIDTARDGILPSNSYGHWEMMYGTPDDWNDLIATVTQIAFPVDFIGTAGEELGYDNICLRDDVCPPIPTLTEWGLIIFGVVLLGFITWVFLRRRNAVAVKA
jgi:hypothetical protein